MAFDEVKRSAFLELTFRGPVYATNPLQLNLFVTNSTLLIFSWDRVAERRVRASPRLCMFHIQWCLYRRNIRKSRHFYSVRDHASGFRQCQVVGGLYAKRSMCSFIISLAYAILQILLLILDVRSENFQMIHSICQNSVIWIVNIRLHAVRYKIFQGERLRKNRK